MPDRARLSDSFTVAALLLACAICCCAAVSPGHATERSQDEQSRAERSAEKNRAKEEKRAEKKSGASRPDAPSTGESARSGQALQTPPSRAPESSGEPPPAHETEALPLTATDEPPIPADVYVEPLDASVGEPEVSGGSIDAAALLADSLAAYESAQAFWEQGLVEEAFATLDRSYELMAAVDVEGDPLRAQEKEDLRRLISRRVIEIYASRPTAAGDLEGSIPLEINEHVQREIQSFSGPERRFFLESYVRSGLHRPMILEELRAGGMPLELAWMPLVESGFKVRAYSVARALGLWQFIPSTGYRFGLERNNWIDERMDPQKATRAAVAYLTELHGLFGDWLTALAAYNCGEHLVLRLMNSQPVSYFDRFWDLYLRLPRETRRYVPRFLAVLAILENPTAHGFDLPEPQPPIEIDLVRTERTADLGELERRLQLADGTLTGLNPELRRNATPGEPYDLKVPKILVDQVAVTIPQLPARVVTAEATPTRSSATTHRVRPGETLSRVAARYGTTVDALVAWNGLSSPDRIVPGQSLRVRSSSSSSGSSGGAARSSASSSAPSQSAAKSGDATTHRVRSGDNLWIIAQRYGTTVDRIKADNGLRSNLLQVGQQLVISSSRSATGAG